MYDDAMDGMSALLLRRTKPSGLLYVGQLHGRSFRPAMEHLACFVGGMLALGAKSSTDFQSARAQRDWKHAKGIAYTCFNVRPGERERECVCERERERERRGKKDRVAERALQRYAQCVLPSFPWSLTSFSVSFPLSFLPPTDV